MHTRVLTQRGASQTSTIKGQSHTVFNRATFSKDTAFDGARFSGEHTDFGAATFSGEHTDFGRARFSGEHTDFGEATFSGECTDFGRAIFSGKLAWFENPQAWNNVTFDWDEKPAHMLPECIRPRDWPPTQLLPEDE